MNLKNGPDYRHLSRWIYEGIVFGRLVNKCKIIEIPEENDRLIELTGEEIEFLEKLKTQLEDPSGYIDRFVQGLKNNTPITTDDAQGAYSLIQENYIHAPFYTETKEGFSAMIGEMRTEYTNDEIAQRIMEMIWATMGPITVKSLDQWYTP